MRKQKSRATTPRWSGLSLPPLELHDLGCKHPPVLKVLRCTTNCPASAPMPPSYSLAFPEYRSIPDTTLPKTPVLPYVALVLALLLVCAEYACASTVFRCRCPMGKGKP